MRYQALAIYAALLRAFGGLVVIGGPVAGGLVGVFAYQQRFNHSVSIAAAGVAVAVTVVGIVGGVTAMALGELFCVGMDIEINTRAMLHQDWERER